VDLWPTFLSAAGERNPQIDPEADDLREIAAPPTQHRFVYSQFSHGPRGLYLITDGHWKYTYSAADEREWLFDLHTDPSETRNLAYNPAFSTQTLDMRLNLIERFRQAGYSEAVDGDGWRMYGKSIIPEDPDWGLLFQDYQGMQKSIDELGEYARRVDLQSNLKL